MFSVFLQLCLAALTFAAPISDEQAIVMGMNPAQQYGTGGGVLGFIVLILDIIVWGMHPLPSQVVRSELLTAGVVEVLKSNRPPSHKILWSLLVFLFPVVGVIIYWLLSDRQKWNAGAGGYEPIA